MDLPLSKGVLIFKSANNLFIFTYGENMANRYDFSFGGGENLTNLFISIFC